MHIFLSAFQRVPRSHLARYSQLASTASQSAKRKVPTDVDESSLVKQKKMEDCTKKASQVSQSTVDKLVVDFVTEGLLPFSVVELSSFKRLVVGLQPGKSVVCRATLKRSMDQRVTDMRVVLCATLQSVDCVATTTDCWSARNRSYLGVTAHWIDPSTLERRSVALACRRLRGSHTFLVLANALGDVHRQYGITRSVRVTTTDNGSNFVKAFSVFGRDRDDSDSEESDGEAGQAHDAPVHDDVHRLLEEDDGVECELPQHRRCVCHTLQLVATTDADAAEEDAAYKRVSRSAFGKCQGLWTKASRSVLSAEAVVELHGLHLLRPCQTRCNSVFFAVERLVRIIQEKGEDALHSLCNQLSVPR